MFKRIVKHHDAKASESFRLIPNSQKVILIFIGIVLALSKLGFDASALLAVLGLTVFPALLLPDWAPRLVISLSILGFPVAAILAWAQDTKIVEASIPDAVDEGLPSRPTLAILPFTNISNDLEQEHFADSLLAL